MKFILAALFGFISLSLSSVSSLAAPTTAFCGFNTKPQGRSSLGFYVEPNSEQTHELDQYQVKVKTDKDGRVTVATIIDTQSGFSANADTLEKASIAVQLISSAVTATFHCEPMSERAMKILRGETP